MKESEVFPLAGPLLVTIVAYKPRPKAKQRRADRGSAGVPHVGKPDVDNLAKLVLDGCTKAGLWRDDSQVVGLTVMRLMLDLDAEGQQVGMPRVEVALTSSPGGA